MNLSQLEKEENMFKAFQFFDKDGSGYITKDELEEALRVRKNGRIAHFQFQAILSFWVN